MTPRDWLLDAHRTTCATDPPPPAGILAQKLEEIAKKFDALKAPMPKQVRCNARGMDWFRRVARMQLESLNRFSEVPAIESALGTFQFLGIPVHEADLPGMEAERVVIIDLTDGTTMMIRDDRFYRIPAMDLNAIHGIRWGPVPGDEGKRA